ncbi:MAG TPA: SemiSWEET transporter [Acidobacteriaceae bacterium]|jgi:MtN3 and saliva related transmembrane protein|nr:SemiSWEET transporter [Acidobacteriaceae bacterium]
MKQSAIDVIGFAAAICTTISFLPQLLRVLKLRSARDISLGMFSIFSFGTALWLAYGILAHSIPVAVANFVTFILASWILILKIKYDAEYERAVKKGEQ